MVGRPATEATFASAADAILAGARGYGGNDFKIPLAHRTIVAVLRQSARQA
jgi:xanthine dehydrogenase YagS FAD-binding subunit